MKVSDRRAAFKRFESRREQAVETDFGTEARDAKGLVFDPDPRSALNDNTLVDSSPESALLSASNAHALGVPQRTDRCNYHDHQDSFFRLCFSIMTACSGSA